MTGPSKKRQARDEYRKATELSQQSPSFSQHPGSTSGSASVQQQQHHALQMPKKKFYRQRAHANPFSDHALTYPTSPEAMDWSVHFPAFARTVSDEEEAEEETKKGSDSPRAEQLELKRQKKRTTMTKRVEIADIGCGFGGLIVALSPLFPETLMIGMELRNQVTDYVVNRVAALRSQNPIVHHNANQNPSPSLDEQSQRQQQQEQEEGKIHDSFTSPRTSILPPYHNISAIRSNTMKFLPNHFHQHQLTKIFLCFPDPHFKQRKHKARIVSAQLNAEYAYVLRPGGKVYTITDVEELHLWMVRHFEGGEAGDIAELWERVVDQQELDEDPCVKVMSEETEEGKKVTRNKGNKYVAVFRRRENLEWVD